MVKWWSSPFSGLGLEIRHWRATAVWTLGLAPAQGASDMGFGTVGWSKVRRVSGRSSQAVDVET